VPGHTAYAYPRLIDQICDRGHEILHHGWVHENPAAFDEAGERQILELGLEALERVPGVTRVIRDGAAIRIEATGDIRGDIARAVVGAGGDLTMIDAGHASLDDVYARFFEGIPNAA
jgi:peptidoglycan/xylan/chitin deacetylase (PgdA/CDA1 family)